MQLFTPWRESCSQRRFSASRMILGVHLAIRTSASSITSSGIGYAICTSSTSPTTACASCICIALAAASAPRRMICIFFGLRQNGSSLTAVSDSSSPSSSINDCASRPTPCAREFDTRKNKSPENSVVDTRMRCVSILSGKRKHVNRIVTARYC